MTATTQSAAKISWMFAEPLDEEVVPRLRAVPLERLGPRHLVHRGVQGFDDRGCQRTSDVADPEANEPGPRVIVLELPHTPRDLREEIARPELQVVVVDSRHGARF